MTKVYRLPGAQPPLLSELAFQQRFAGDNSARQALAHYLIGIEDQAGGLVVKIASDGSMSLR